MRAGFLFTVMASLAACSQAEQIEADADGRQAEADTSFARCVLTSRTVPCSIYERLNAVGVYAQADLESRASIIGLTRTYRTATIQYRNVQAHGHPGELAVCGEFRLSDDDTWRRAIQLASTSGTADLEVFEADQFETEGGDFDRLWNAYCE